MRLFADPEGNLPENLPFFPNSEGGTVDKKDVVATVDQLALEMDLPIVDHEGRNLYGGHVSRVSGAQRLTIMGISEPCIMVLARWSPRVLLRYIVEAPLVQLTTKFRQMAQIRSGVHVSPIQVGTHCSQGSGSQTSDFNSNETLEKLAKINSQIEIMCNQVRQQDAKIAKIARRQASQPKFHYVVQLGSDKRAKTHVSSSDVAAHPDHWVTACGWPYGKWKFRRIFPAEASEEDKINCD